MPHDVSNSTKKTENPPGLRSFFAWAMLMILLFLGATLWLTGWQGGDADPEEVQRAELRIKTLAELRADNAKKLESYAWVDRAKGSVQIPIGEAMKLVLADINKTQPQAAYPVAKPESASTPGAAPVPSPSASPTPATSGVW